MMKLPALLVVLLSLLAVSSPSRADAPPFTLEFKAGQLKLTPPAQHHFNTEAPNQIRIGEKKLKLKISEPEITARVPSKLKQGSEGTATIYVCDNAKTYCQRQERSFSLSSGGAPAAAPSGVPSTSKGAARPRSHGFDRKTGFWLNEPEKALAQAAREKKPLVIDFFGIWCPPCNHLDAMVFKNTEFRKKLKSGFVALKMDSDEPISEALKKKYKIIGLPTVIFATPGGDEISRVLGYRPPREMLRQLGAALAHPEEGYATLLARAKSAPADSPEGRDARLRAAEISIDQGKLDEAIALVKDLKDQTADTVFRAKYESAMSRPDYKGAEVALQSWLKVNSSSPTAFWNLMNLGDLQDELGDHDGKKRTLESVIALAKTLIAAPPETLETSDTTTTDLWEALADSYDELGRAPEAKAAYSRCAQEAAAEGKKEGGAFARGPSLDRGYCLAKAGDLDAGEAVYREGVKRFPNEFTYHKALAEFLLKDRNNPREALAQADLALKYAYGTQRLKAGMTKVKTLEKLGRFQQGIRTIDEVLGTTQGISVSLSSKGLRKQLEDKKAEFQKKL